MQVPGVEQKKYWKIPGVGESFDGIPREERKKTMENFRGDAVKVLMEFQGRYSF